MLPYPIPELGGEIGYTSLDLAKLLEANNGRILAKFDGHNFKDHLILKSHPEFKYAEHQMPPDSKNRGGRRIRLLFLNLFATKVILCHYNSKASRVLLIDIFNYEIQELGVPRGNDREPQASQIN